MEKTNYISLAIRNIREMFKNGGFTGNDKDYSYWLVVFKNGEEKVIDNFSVAWDGMPKLHAREIKEVRSWFSGGPHTYHIEEVYTKDTYSASDNMKEMLAREEE